MVKPPLYALPGWRGPCAELSKNASYLPDDEVITSGIVRLGGLNSVARLKDHLRILGINIPCDNELACVQQSPLSRPLVKEQFSIGNRIAVQPRADDFGSVYSIPLRKSGTTLFRVRFRSKTSNVLVGKTPDIAGSWFATTHYWTGTGRSFVGTPGAGLLDPTLTEVLAWKGVSLVSAAGFEPATHALKGHCSTN